MTISISTLTKFNLFSQVSAKNLQHPIFHEHTWCFIFPLFSSSILLIKLLHFLLKINKMMVKIIICLSSRHWSEYEWLECTFLPLEFQALRTSQSDPRYRFLRESSSCLMGHSFSSMCNFWHDSWSPHIELRFRWWIIP